MTRQCVEAFVCLAVAVVLFRGFAAEGYMISTGSMAPCLLGYHRQVVCPSCSFAFSRGTHFDDDQTILAAGAPDLGGDFYAPSTICPNCGLSSIDTSAVPRNEGDQLLVHKHFYQLRSPRRWEVVVFRHPTDPAQAYVKRVVGLPEESVEVIEGDVYANGKLQRKPLETQRSMRIAVYDHDYEPVDPEWSPRWRTDQSESPWKPHQRGFVHYSAGDGTDGLTWLTYHHWIRSGGDHLTWQALDRWPDGLPEAPALDRRLTFDAGLGRLQYRGVMPSQLANHLRRQTNDPDWQRAIDTLAENSHEGPIGDLYGYNHPRSGDGPQAVHDLMLEVTVDQIRGAGEWRLQMADGWHRFEIVFDHRTHEVRLFVDDQPRPVEAAGFSPDLFSEQAVVEMSLFDRQVVLAVNGSPVLEPLTYSAESTPRQLTSRPVRIGATGLDLHLSHVRLFRDVHYTPKSAPDRDPVTRLRPDEFYMLGDNSPVSVDSRAWDSPAIPRSLLIGKPFLVHLPSRQGRVEVAGSVQHIRIPDFTRVRYIR